jgi:hypothetical protein
MVGIEFLLSMPVISVLGPTQPATQLVSGIKRLERDACHSPLTSAELKNAWHFASIPPHVFKPVVFCGIS